MPRRCPHTFVNGAKRALSSFRFLLDNKRLVAFLTIPYFAVFPIYVHYFDLGPLFSFFPLTQVQFLLFRYISNLQTSIQTSIKEYTFFSLPDWLHYIWIPLIYLVFNFIHVLFICYAAQIMRTKKVGNIEKALIQTNTSLSDIALWALISTLIIFPLSLLWSFTKQVTFIKEFMFEDHPFVAFVLTSPSFSIFILFLLFLYQIFSYCVLPAIALENQSFMQALKHSWHMIKHMGIFILGGTLILSLVWGSATSAFNPFLSVFAVPIVINAAALIFAMTAYYECKQEKNGQKNAKAPSK